MPYVDRFGWCVDQSRRARAVRADNAGERFVPHLFSSFFSILDPRRALAVDLSLAALSLPFPLPSPSSSSYLFFTLFIPFFFLLRLASSSSSSSFSSSSSSSSVSFRFSSFSFPLNLLFLLYIPSASTRYRHQASSLVFRRVFMRLRWIYSRIPLASSRQATRRGVSSVS